MDQEPIRIIIEKCTGCKLCEKVCPYDAIHVIEKKAVVDEKCTLCGACVDTCKKEALKLQFDGSTFIFIIEPITGMNAKEVVGGTVKVLLDKSKEYSKTLQKIK